MGLEAFDNYECDGQMSMFDSEPPKTQFSMRLGDNTTTVWETPKELFNELNDEFRFDVDVCALPENAKCKDFFTPEMNGLLQDWSGRRCWCNPPYGRDIKKWVKKAYESNTLVVMLLPARTDTSWFHDYVLDKAEIRFIRGRLRYGSSKFDAPFPSMIVVYNKVWRRFYS